MQQVVDLQEDESFRGLDVELLSISPDPVEDWAEAGGELGITTPLLSDAENRVATAYGVMRWSMPSGEPGHTFVLVDGAGTVTWVRDYGVVEGLMYVPPIRLVEELRERIER